MKHLRKNGGFTLIEMVVCIAIASLVTMAATTVLMLALRVNRQTSDTATQQYTVRALLTTMERAATDGSIKGLVSGFDSWQLIDQELNQPSDGGVLFENARVIFGFDAANQMIYTNGMISATYDAEAEKVIYEVQPGTMILSGVYASSVYKDDEGMLSLAIETKTGIFESTVFLRGSSIDRDTEIAEPGTSENADVNKFLAILMSQLYSDGRINYDNLKQIDPSYVTQSHETYYSEWYINQTYVNGVGQGGWNKDTPWCACFVSWALVEAGESDPTKRYDAYGEKIQWYAKVDEFLDYLKQTEQWKEQPEEESITPNPGDLVFFDWITDDGVDNPQHVGVVLCLTDSNNDGVDDSIITIEGNSAGRVAVRRYPIDDPRILGYATVIS